jgi:hypothetical protein
MAIARMTQIYGEKPAFADVTGSCLSILSVLVTDYNEVYMYPHDMSDKVTIIYATSIHDAVAYSEMSDEEGLMPYISMQMGV